MFPSNRPEQGYTRRSQEHVDSPESSYLELGLNPDQLNDFNVPKEKQSQLSTVQPQARNHRRPTSWSPRHGYGEGSRFREDLDGLGKTKASQRHSLSVSNTQAQTKIPELASLDATVPCKNESHTAADLLRAHEETRHRRRSLKQSGDWLGVTGADRPYAYRQCKLHHDNTHRPPLDGRYVLEDREGEVRI
jgi:hypothetical protein